MVGINMFTKKQSAIIKNYIEVFFAAVLIVFAVSFLLWNKGNHFNNMGATAFLLSGVMIILKANWEYKKRKYQKEENN
jgi:hypothetical protein